MAGLPQRPVAGPSSRPLIARPAAGLAPSPFANTLGQIAAQAAANSFSGHAHSPFAPHVPLAPTRTVDYPAAGPPQRGRGQAGRGRGGPRGRGESRGRGRGRGAGPSQSSMPSSGPPYLPPSAQPVYGAQSYLPSRPTWTDPSGPAPPPIRYTEDGYGISSTAVDPGPMPARETFDCLNCRKTFNDPMQLLIHQSQHIRCDYPECTWDGLPSELEVHKEDRHLIFSAERQRKPRERTEEEQAALARGARIEGTNITLKTDEDIQKWISERKKRFPTVSNVAEKMRQRAEMSLSRPSRAPLPPQNASYAPGAPTSQPPSDRGRGRGRGRGGSARGRGTGDERSSKRPRTDAHEDSTPVVDKQPSLSLGLVAYSSDSWSSSSSETSDDEAPVASAPAPAPPAEPTPPAAPNICPDWHRSGACPRGATCTLPHLGRPEDRRRGAGPTHAALPASRPAPRHPFARSGSELLSHLLARDVAQGVSDLAHAIDFLVANDFLANVELVPGEADEQPIQELLSPALAAADVDAVDA